MVKRVRCASSFLRFLGQNERVNEDLTQSRGFLGGWGEQNACQKLYVRARDLMDTAGVLRTPSKESIAVLILSSQLAMYNHDLQAFRGQVRSFSFGTAMDEIIGGMGLWLMCGSGLGS